MKSFKTELNLNNKQRTLMAKHAGTSRHAYNWGLAICIEAKEKGEKRPSAVTLHKRLVAEVKSQYEWYYEVSKCAPQQALRDLDSAFKNFFTVKGRGFPRFKKKGRNDSFYLEGNIQIRGNQIRLPRIGWVRTYEKHLPPILVKSNSNVTISRHADKWLIAYKVDVEPEKIDHPQGIVGVDLGVKTLATLSDGVVFPAVHAYRSAKRKLASLSRSVSRKVKGSNNRKKAIKRLAKAHYRVACIRQDATHKLTSYLAKNHSEVVIEDLNVSGMLKNHRLAQAIADGGFYEFRRQLEYKCQWYGSQLTVVDRFFPSSKTCSDCGEIKKDLKLKDRTFVCPSCGLFLDRDLNAAINLAKACPERSRRLALSAVEGREVLPCQPVECQNNAMLRHGGHSEAGRKHQIMYSLVEVCRSLSKFFRTVGYTTLDLRQFPNPEVASCKMSGKRVRKF